MKNRHVLRICIIFLVVLNQLFCNEKLKESNISTNENSNSESEGKSMYSLKSKSQTAEKELMKNFKCDKENCKNKYVFQIKSSNEKKESYNKENVLDEISTNEKIATTFSHCKEENCKYCCLSTNRCGSQKQCENKKKYTFVFNIIFFVLCITLFTILAIKYYQIDGYPDQEKEDKLDKKYITELMTVFNLIRRDKSVKNS